MEMVNTDYEWPTLERIYNQTTQPQVTRHGDEAIKVCLCSKLD